MKIQPVVITGRIKLGRFDPVSAVTTRRTPRAFSLS